MIASWWTPLVVVSVAAAGTAAVVAAVFFGGRATRIFAGVLAVVVPATIAALPLAGDYGCFEPTGTWSPPLVGCTVVAAVVAWRRRWPVYLVLAGLIAVAVDVYVASKGGVLGTLESLARTWLMEGFFACTSAGILRAAVQLDEATTAAVRQAAVAATAEATDRERARFAGLIHDNVLSTLLDAARGNDPDALSRAAARTLRQLDDTAHDAADDVTAWATIESVRAATAAAGDFTVEADIAARAGALPREVVTALSAAAAEAARNSMRHAAIDGRAVSRTLAVAVDGHGATVRIADDGAGFDPRRVGADRLGIRHSIVARMHRVPGGDAVIDARPGHGCEVVLRWMRAEPVASHLPTLISLRGRSGIVMLILIELAIAMLMLGPLTGGANPVTAIIAYALTGAAGAAVLIPRHDPLPPAATALIVLAGPAAVVTTQIAPPAHFVHHASWILMAYAYALALLVVRGRIGAAWIGVAAALGVFAGIDAGPLDGAGAAAGIVLAVTGFAVYMRPTLRSFHQARAEVARHAGAEARTAAQDRERRSQLAYLDRTARPMLERIAAGAALTDAQRAECSLLEAQLRDRLRAPGFATAEMAEAARRARSLGVTVTLLDDGGLDAVPGAVRDRVLEIAIAAVDAAIDGRITVRALPPGRDLLATIVAQSEYPQRIEIAPDGSVLPVPEPTVR